jgi:rsbT antagonist protein RsbS
MGGDRSSIPILRQGDRLIVSLQGELGDAEWGQLTDDLLERVSDARCRSVVLDLSVVDVVDSYASRTIMRLTQMVQLRGARMAVAGIRPAVAFSMVQLGVSFEGIPTALDLDDALALLDE